MKRTLVLVFIVFGFIIQGISQNQKPVFVSNTTLAFDRFISGVRYAEIMLSAPNQEQVDKREGIAGFYFLAQKYLKQLGFEYVALTSEEKTELEVSIQSYCEFTSVNFSGDIDKKSISNMSITFISCDGDIFSFQSQKKFSYGRFSDVENKIIEDWQGLVRTKPAYKRENQLILPSNPTYWNDAGIKDYLTENASSLKPVEGIYERIRLSFEDLSGGKYMVGIIKNPDADGFLIIYLSGARNHQDWRTGEIKGTLQKTSTSGFYTVGWIARDKSYYEDVYCTLDEVGVSIFSSGIIPLSYKFIKVFPSTD